RYPEAVFGVRDVVWSVVICVALTLFVQCRPVWSARRFIERESNAGFVEAYTGRRFANGEVIAGFGKGAHVDHTAPLVVFRRLEITAERSAWTGKKAEFVVRHLIELQGLSGDADPSQEIHVQIERQGPRWVYTLFEVRGSGPIEAPNTGNPWARALKRG
ncbi:MAG: hypothetical protein ACRETX_13795, partial [Steroidobacteraceae bacterium]